MSQDPTTRTGTPKDPGPLYRSGFRIMSGIHSFFYRPGVGRRAGPLPQVLLTTTGRKSGKPHTVALGAMPQGDGWVVIASFGGADVDPSWWLNLMANPDATLQVNDRVIRVRVRAIADPAEFRRKIPLGLLRPVS